MRIIKKTLLLFLPLIIIVFSVSACGSGDTIPNGRYEPVDANAALTVMQSIEINGDNCTLVFPLGMFSQTYKYTYSDGTITFDDDTAGVSVACEYKDDSLWYAGLEFVLSE